MVVCPHLDGALGARRLLERAIDELAKPVSAGSVEHQLRATLGLVVSPPGEAESSAVDLLRHAESARERAKESGWRYAVFTPGATVTSGRGGTPREKAGAPERRRWRGGRRRRPLP